MPRWLLYTVLALTFRLTYERDDDFEQKRIAHEPIEIAPHKLATVAGLTDRRHLREAIERITIPRVVGTPGHKTVREYISKSLTDLGWTVTVDQFEDTAPVLGRLQFENVVAKLNPNAERYLMLAAHYDSKFFSDYEFLGAVDSGVPCAMLVNLAHTMKPYLDRIKSKTDLSLMFVFFDGEEAFEKWSPTDSIYGARHLAQRWNQENFLRRIDVFVLLDLLGASDPKFYSFFKKTESWYLTLVSAEERLAAGNHLAKYTTSSVSRPATGPEYFQPMSANSYIEDDHIPFLNLNVPILHLIPIPFPDCWHKKEDNLEVVDYDTVENLNKILRVFVLEYLNIDV